MPGKLTSRQYDVLGIVDGHGPATPAQVAYHIPIGASSTRSVLAALERKGFVSANYTASTTARSYEITSDGQAALEAAEDDASAELNAMMAARDRRKGRQS